MKKFTFISIFLFILCMSFDVQASGARVFISVPENVRSGDTFFVDLKADTEGELINSVDFEIAFNSDIFSFAGYKNDGNVVRLWVNPPEAKGGKIIMSGIIPGGALGLYDAERQSLGPIPLVRLILVAKSPGTGKFDFLKSEILKNDGKGTPLPHAAEGADIAVKEKAGDEDTSKDNSTYDKTPPEPFSLTFLKSSLFSRTPSMVIFQANDTDSGIKKYQIKIGVGGWHDAKSPAPVGKGIFPRTVIVRAFDSYDNFRDASMEIPGSLSWPILLTILLLIVSGIWAYKLIK